MTQIQQQISSNLGLSPSLSASGPHKASKRLTEDPPYRKRHPEQHAKRTRDDHNNERLANGGIERVKRRPRPVYPECDRLASCARGDREEAFNAHRLSLVPPSRTLASHPLITSRYRFPNTLICIKLVNANTNHTEECETKIFTKSRNSHQDTRNAGTRWPGLGRRIPS